MTEPPLHRRLLDEALRLAPARGGWLHLPDLPLDYRGPTEVPFRPLGPGCRDRPALALLAEAAERLPDHPAFEDPTRALSFRETMAAIGRLAPLLAGEGPVGVVIPGGIEAPVAQLACLAAGRPAVLLDALHPTERSSTLLQRMGGRLVVGPSATAAAVAGLAGLPMVAVEHAFDETRPVLPIHAEALGPDDPACIIPTSGSTGEPKCVAYGQRGLLHQARLIAEANHLSDRDRFLLLAPGASFAGPPAFLLPIWGCTLAVLSLAEVGFAELRARLRDRPVTVMRVGPTVLRGLARLPDAAAVLASVRVLRLAGEALLASDVTLLRSLLPPACLIQNRYGSTEMAGAACFLRPEEVPGDLRAPVGLPDPDIEVLIADEDGLSCPPGEAGELWLRGRYASLGEWDATGLTPGRLLADASDPALRVYRTGDIAQLTPDGMLVLLGRRDRMVKVNGNRVELAEIETALRGCAEVRQAAVVARDSAGRVSVHAFVVPAAGTATGLEARLRHALREALPAFMQPTRIALLDALPQLPGGKLDELALQDLAARRG